MGALNSAHDSQVSEKFVAVATALPPNERLLPKWCFWQHQSSNLYCGNAQSNTNSLRELRPILRSVVGETSR
jgi:hypothetical protein